MKIRKVENRKTIEKNSEIKKFFETANYIGKSIVRLIRKKMKDSN